MNLKIMMPILMDAMTLTFLEFPCPRFRAYVPCVQSI